MYNSAPLEAIGCDEADAPAVSAECPALSKSDLERCQSVAPEELNLEALVASRPCVLALSNGSPGLRESELVHGQSALEGNAFDQSEEFSSDVHGQSSASKAAHEGGVVNHSEEVPLDGLERPRRSRHGSKSARLKTGPERDVAQTEVVQPDAQQTPRLSRLGNTLGAVKSDSESVFAPCAEDQSDAIEARRREFRAPQLTAQSDAVQSAPVDPPDAQRSLRRLSEPCASSSVSWISLIGRSSRSSSAADGAPDPWHTPLRLGGQGQQQERQPAQQTDDAGQSTQGPILRWSAILSNSGMLNEPLSLDGNGNIASREELLERGLTVAEADALMVRQNELNVMQEHFARWLLWLGVVVISMSFANVVLQIWLVVELAEFGGASKPCSVPLDTWAHVLVWYWIARLLMPIFDRICCCWRPDNEENQAPQRPPPRIFRKNVALAVFECIWIFGVGLHWVSIDVKGERPPCQIVAPEFFRACVTYIYFRLASMIFVWLNLIGLRRVMIGMIHRGFLRTSSAASPEAVEKNTEIVKLTASELENHPSCSICIEDYKPGEFVMKTRACGHFYHKKCLKNWLQASRTCPVCRQDLGVVETE